MYFVKPSRMFASQEKNPTELFVGHNVSQLVALPHHPQNCPRHIHPHDQKIQTD